MHAESKAIPESEGHKPAEENEHGKSTFSNGRYWLLSGILFMKIKSLNVSLYALLTLLTLTSGASLLQPTPTLMYVLVRLKRACFYIFGLSN